MKMDKEFLLKNRFWVGLVVFAPLWLIALIMILVIGGGSLAEGEKAVKDAKGKVTSINNPKTQLFTDPLEVRRQVLQGQKDRVWQKAWDTQTDLMTWPEISEGGSERTREVYARLTKLGYFGEDIPYTALQDHPLHYKNQLPLEEIVRRTWPVEANWGQLVKRANFVTDRVPSVEEAWLAQEDLWVYNELINVLEAAQDSVARFENVAVFKKLTIDPDEDREREKALAAAGAPGASLGQVPGTTAPGAAPPGSPTPAPVTAPVGEPGSAEDKPKEAEPTHLRFRNPFWQFDLYVKPNEKKQLVILPKSSIRNVTADRVSLPGGAITFLLAQQLQVNVDPVTAQLTFTSEKATPWMAWVELKKPVVLPTGFNAKFDKVPLSVEVEKDDSWKAPAGALARYRFRSPNWEMDTIVGRDPRNPSLLQISEKSTVKNINLSRRPLDLGKAIFRVSQGAGRGGFDFQIPADILTWNQSTEIRKPVSIGAFDPARPLELKQVFTWPTSPIKRVNALELYYHSHKTSNRALTQGEQFKKPDDPNASAADAGGGAMGGGGGMSGMLPPPGGMSMGMGGPGGSADGGGAIGRTQSNRTLNGLEKNRYIYVSPQVRRMPVAVSLIVDQAYMQDVLTAIANSRLRIQITQVQWSHAENVRPSSPDSLGSGPPGGFPDGGGRGDGDSGSPDGGAPRPGGGGFRPGMGGGMRPGGMPPGGMAPGGMGAGGFGGAGGLTQEEVDPNLVDLAIYGIASLYERFPPKPKPGEGTPPSTDSTAATAAPK